uniref:Peptidase S1 domain-containing protein n=1 Tax=Megaselia scalaris TaxID=36166 RepID=T1H4T3_MEGSC
AYCYTEGSFCQQWLQAQIEKSQTYDIRPSNTRRNDFIENENSLHQSTSSGITSSNSNVNSHTNTNDFIMNGRGYRGQEYEPMKLKCGIAPALRNNRRNMNNLLKIIGGKASRKGEWPWQVAIFNRYKEAFCGGTLIAPQWILTAAHCLRKVLYVRLGEHNLDFEDGSELQFRVLRSYKHPSFDRKTVDSDIALLNIYTLRFAYIP